MKRRYLSILLMFLLSVSLIACGNEEPSSGGTEEDTEQVEEEEYEEDTEQVEEEEYEEDTEQVEEDKPTREQRSAREAAFNYLFKARNNYEADDGEKNKIAEQLEDDGYPEDAVNYALQEIKFKALDLLEDYYFSDLSKGQPERDESGKVAMLHGYPEDAINYAWENISIDYDEQALFRAKKLRGSNTQIKEQLIEKGFTEEQSQYAIDHLD